LYRAGYLDTAGRASFLPASVDEARVLLRFYLLESALLELSHELTQRPEWVRILIHGLLGILDSKRIINRVTLSFGGEPDDDQDDSFTILTRSWRNGRGLHHSGKAHCHPTGPA
jgi:hypothetical protein